ncbi:MAG: hypothetical protein NZ899_10085 [Thermoguttaceae bacterium]|nr:hypothetical protein [Thermoguttaceae bacterium]
MPRATGEAAMMPAMRAIGDPAAGKHPSAGQMFFRLLKTSLADDLSTRGSSQRVFVLRTARGPSHDCPQGPV